MEAKGLVYDGGEVRDLPDFAHHWDFALVGEGKGEGFF